MSHNYNFYFPCFSGVSPFQRGIPFFLGVRPLSRPPAVWLLSRRGFGGCPPARPPATHAAMRHAQPVRAGVVPFFIPFLLFISVPPFCSRR